MPNKQSRTRGPRSRGPTRQPSQVATINAWSTGGSGPEVKTYYNVYNNTQLYHNLGMNIGNVINQLDQITQGTAVYQRLGNKIFVKDIEIIMVLNNKADRPNVSYRAVVVASPATVGSDTFTETFYGGNFTGTHYTQNSICLHDAFVPTNQGSTMVAPTKERSFVHRVMIPVNKMVTYDNVAGKAQTLLGCYVSTYDAYATLTTDNIASIAQATIRIGFVDA